ncbi:MAG: [citrate (pro-3S)-lyase] ligase [Deferribacteraceae bacterium]|jgi:[citrate (pro-3S)-lyase] ligase|nr:[citrate (pro-3S)-lyase] ligase [Deferribacteraceae bacterium]
MEIIVGSPLSERQIAKTKEFLSRLNLDWEENPDTTVNIYDGAFLVATGSRHKNVLRCVGASCKYRGEGLATQVATELVKDALAKGYSHLFIYTKPENVQTFGELGFYLVAVTDDVALLENRKDGVKKFVESLGESERSAVIGGIVANCNPFTNGHLYLMETAAASCDHLYVFVLSEDASEFSAEERLMLVRKGTAHIKNLSVYTTGDYLISSATFPQYFLRDKANINRSQCRLDVKIFAEHFAKALGITKRFVGTEPLSAITQSYNDEMQQALPQYGIELVILERKENGNEPISASRVRKLIAEANWADIEKIVPKTIYEYILSRFGS